MHCMRMRCAARLGRRQSFMKARFVFEKFLLLLRYQIILRLMFHVEVLDSGVDVKWRGVPWEHQSHLNFSSYSRLSSKFYDEINYLTRISIWELFRIIKIWWGFKRNEKSQDQPQYAVSNQSLWINPISFHEPKHWTITLKPNIVH